MSVSLSTKLIRGAARVLGRGPLDPRTPLRIQRLSAELAGYLLRPPRGITVRPEAIGGVPGEWIKPTTAGTGSATILYLHGGGYVLGSPRAYRGLVGHLARSAKVRAFVPHYRRAPEHPFPAAVNDAVAAYRGLLAQGVAADRIAVVGDSAGAALALTLASRLRDGAEPLPAVIAMVCPWLDLTADGPAHRPPSPAEPLISPAKLEHWAALYARGHADDPAASPLYGRLGDLPQIILHSAGDDPLAADADRLEQAAREQGARLDHIRHPGLWHAFHVFAPVMREAARAVDELGTRLRAALLPQPQIAIVGAGISGLCMAATLRRAGIDTFTVYEKAADLGGVWRDNTYPGLRCDIQSRVYCYSFAPNPSWSKLYSPQEEILEYLRRVAGDAGLHPHIRFNTEITETVWNGRQWCLRAAGDPIEHHADVLIAASGYLRQPSVPAIAGLETFGGATFHSSEWDHTVPVEGRRVAVIGTGASGVQITSALAGVAGRLLVFQRTPQWLLPMPDLPYRRWTKSMYRRWPKLQKIPFRFYGAIMERFFAAALVRPGWQRRTITELCRLHLRFAVKEPELRRQLTPDDAPMCKRLVTSSTFYQALGREDVSLVSSGIDHVEPRGIVTSDGTLHDADVIVLATGFDAHTYMRPMKLSGEGGRTLDRAWSQGPYAYRTTALPGFPNFFMICGPHSPIGSQVVPRIAETQAAYIVRWIEILQEERVASLSPTEAATARFNHDLRNALNSGNTVWTSGCHSYYLDTNDLPELWPWPPSKHRKMLQEPARGDFVLRMNHPDSDKGP
ncbi:alpha/beta hydrolase fold domain-containing protein [Streptomyces sp. NBC_01296]|uniref:alpha/beta hydrolase fold domain-containing protein n=1 Tax=Streptomyces sp. NBC_01296 TaxID=2903816 RepID=UPI002E11E53B|nr:alpha/beta hydrolase fold domain-containing protein [Streptomyces sp. NBC_01296]